MQFLKSLLSSGSSSSPVAEANELIQSTLADSKGPLALSFLYSIKQTVASSVDLGSLLSVLIQKANECSCASILVKLYTIIHCLIVERGYSQSELDVLENLRKAPLDDKGGHKSWLEPLSHAYTTYMAKLPAMGEIYQRSLVFTVAGKVNPSQHFGDIFTIINTVNVLFPALSSSTNTVGRYYYQGFPEYVEFNKVLNQQLLRIYGYLEFLISDLMTVHCSYDESQLKCFLQTVPEIELCCDKLEDWLLNKYYRNKSIAKKIIVKVQNISQITYYLTSRPACKSLSDDEEDGRSTQ